MTKNCNIIKGLLLVCGIFAFSISAFSQQVPKTKKETPVALTNALKKITKTLGTQFVYDPLQLQGKFTSYNLDDIKSKAVEDVLKAILYPNDLVFLYVKSNYYTIVTKDRVGETLRSQSPTVSNEIITNITTTADKAVIKVDGKVIDEETKAPLANVTVTERGTRNAVATDGRGNFSINLKTKNAVLLFTIVGYQAQQLNDFGSGNVTVALSNVASSLSEVVVVGYGAIRKKDLTGSVGQVKMADLQKAPVRSFEEALAGRVAGVTANASDGQPGATVNIIIRGSNSLTQDNSPLYVIDGFPIENPDNNAINPSDIESIEILKDASSTAIYGARGANGVILITTKKGKIGKTVINYNVYYGFQQNNKKMDMMNPYDFVRYQFERDSANTNKTYLINGNTLDDFKNAQGTDLQDLLFRRSPFLNHFLSLSGGTKDTKYSVSGSILDQKGILTNSGYKRYQGRIKLDQRVNDNLNVGVNANYSFLNQFGVSPAQEGNGFFYGNLLYSVWAFRPVSGNITDPVDVESDNTDFLTLNGFNPIKTAQNELRNKVSDVLTSDAYAEYSIAKSLKLRITGGLTKTKTRNDVFDNSQTPKGSPLTKSGQDNGVTGSVIYTDLTSWVNENTLTYNKKINESNQINILGGFTMSGSKVSSYGAAANHIPNEALGTSGIDEGQPIGITSTSSKFTLASFLGRVNYTLFSRYLFTASIRADGSSKFAPENRWSYFPSGAIAWRIIDEGFMKSLPFISNAKLRASYGSTGNNRVTDFAYLSRINLPSNLAYSYNNQPSTVSILTALGNKNLKWETTKQADIGFELGLFHQRISLETDVYRKVTSNLLLDAAIPGSLGFSSALKNIGRVQNEGIEFTLNTVNITSKNFSWNSNFNISFNRNKVLALSDNETQRLTIASWDTYTQNVPLYIAETGQPIARFWGYIWDGNYQYSDFDSTGGVFTIKSGVPSYGVAKNIRPGDIKFRDINGDGVVNANDRTVIGNPNPDFTGGFSNNLTYKNFDLNFFFSFSKGGDVININRIKFEGGGPINQNMFATYNNRWTPDNQNNIYYRTGGAGPVDYVYNTRVIEDGSYIKLKTVSLGYNIPAKIINRIKISNLRIYVSAQNLHTWTKYKGFDPEVSKFGSDALRPSFDYSVYPYAKTVTFGLNVSF